MSYHRPRGRVYPGEVIGLLQDSHSHTVSLQLPVNLTVLVFGSLHWHHIWSITDLDPLLLHLHTKYFDVWLEQYLRRVENGDIQTYKVMLSSQVTREWTEMEILQSGTTKSNPKRRKNRSQKFSADRPRCGPKVEFKRKSRGMKCGAEPEGNTKRMVHVCDSLTVNSDLLPGKSPSLTISWCAVWRGERAGTHLCYSSIHSSLWLSMLPIGHAHTDTHIHEYKHTTWA